MCVCPFTVKEDCVSDAEDDVSTDALVEEMLQQGDTAVIYPEAPEDEPQRQGTPDASVHDENGTRHHHRAFTVHSCYTKHYQNTHHCCVHIPFQNYHYVLYALTALNVMHISISSAHKRGVDSLITHTHTHIHTHAHTHTHTHHYFHPRAHSH